MGSPLTVTVWIALGLGLTEVGVIVTVLSTGLMPGIVVVIVVTDTN